MVPMVFGYFSLLFKLMLESRTNYVRGTHSIRQTRVPSGTVRMTLKGCYTC